MRLLLTGFALVLCIGLVARLHAEDQTRPAGQPPSPASVAQGKIVAMHGQVEHAKARVDTWDPAQAFQALYVAERVRTLAASRAAILFIDETQVKLNAGAVLAIREMRAAGGKRTLFELSLGEGWFRTKNPASGLTIQTPAAAASIRGSEINVRVQPDQQTVLTVVEGDVEFGNEAGSLLVVAGEEATAVPGQPPTKRIMLTPEDAVQWALYYPVVVAWHDLPAAARSAPGGPGFDRLRAGDPAGALRVFEAGLTSDPWSRIGASMAYIERGDLSRARSVLDQPAADTAAEAARRAQRAAVALVTGEAAAARAEIEAALAQDPTAARPLALLSSLELTQNRREAAEAAARSALEAHPNSVGARIAASEAAQARFDLRAAEAHLDAALAIDPTDVRALVNRARIRFGSGATRGAGADANQAAAVAPDQAAVRSLLGFIRLAGADLDGARADFEVAAEADPELGEPHLGLGLVHFRRQDVGQGLLEMLTATLLEPKVALYQSYLAKAYYQVKRFPEGLSALETAKRLDPRDPTPWLYASLFLRDLNRQVDALNELRQAIALNDNRAVYRSRLLLDRDLATKNVSVAEIYRQLGFEAWGASEALNSLEADFTNASAHLFMSDTYGRLPDRTQALGSELLQYFLYAPVNRNSFNNFNEYTALIEQPRRQLTLTIEAGSRDRAFGDVFNQSGNERFAHAAFVQASREDGFRVRRGDERAQGFFMGKFALGSTTDLFFNATGVKSDRGESEDRARIFGLETGRPIVVRQFADTPSPLPTTLITTAAATVGFKHNWQPGSSFTASARIFDLEQDFDDPEQVNALDTPFGPLVLSRAAVHLRQAFRSYDLQAQQVTRMGRHQFIAGAQVFSQQKELQRRETVLFSLFGRPGTRQEAHDVDDHTALAYLRDEIQLTARAHATVGVTYHNARYGDEFSGRTFDLDRINPLAGVSVRIAPNTFIRAAGFRAINSNFIGDKISPTTVAGFVIERNEFPTTKRGEVNLALERGWTRAFASVRTFRRDAQVPLLMSDQTFVPEADTRALGTSTYFNWIAGRRVSLFADDQFVRIETPAFIRTDNLVRVGVNLVHERGVLGRLSGSYITQRFGRTHVTDLPRSSFVVVDLDLVYEFAGKRGRLSLVVANLFDRRFATVIEGLSLDRLRPDQRALLTFRWRLF